MVSLGWILRNELEADEAGEGAQYNPYFLLPQSLYEVASPEETACALFPGEELHEIPRKVASLSSTSEISQTRWQIQKKQEIGIDTIVLFIPQTLSNFFLSSTH